MKKLPLIALLLASCAEAPTDPYTGNAENQALRAWISLNEPALLENLQPEGDFYVDIIQTGDQTAPISAQQDVWVNYKIESRTLNGDVILQRDSTMARRLGKFDPRTHYVPFRQFAGEAFFESSFRDGLFRALRQTLTLGAQYASDHALPRELKLGAGAEFVLYVPSEIIRQANGDGGYGGQYSLAENRPMRIWAKIEDQTTNPIAAESKLVDDFASINGGFDPSLAHTGAERWKIASSLAAQVYFDPTYSPATTYQYTSSYYTDPTIDQRINAALLERFGAPNPKTIIGRAQTARIWYIVRSLDGFVLQSNIDEVNKIARGGKDKSGSVLSYRASTSAGSSLGAWQYALPHFRFGTYGAFVTPSSNAFGGGGVTGTNSEGTTQTAYYSDAATRLAPDLTANYYSAFYNRTPAGNDGSGTLPSDYYASETWIGTAPAAVTSWQSTSVSSGEFRTEILPYTPILVQFYVEEKE